MQTLRGYLHAVQISQTLLVENKKLTKNTLNEHIHDHTVYIQFHSFSVHIFRMFLSVLTQHMVLGRVSHQSLGLFYFNEVILRHEKESYEVCIRDLMDTTTKPNYSVLYILQLYIFLSRKREKQWQWGSCLQTLGDSLNMNENIDLNSRQQFIIRPSDTKCFTRTV